MYKRYALPMLNHINSELMHQVVRRGLHLAQQDFMALEVLRRLGNHTITNDPRLAISLASLSLRNPLIVGAGWDKNGVAVPALCALGFAGVEVGTVTRLPQEGNPKPRQFARDGVVLNHLGFPNAGLEVVLANLQSYHIVGCPIGVNIGNNGGILLQDFTERLARPFVQALYPVADYFTLNVSCPNVIDHYTLKDMMTLINSVHHAMDSLGAMKPVFLKISPDLTLIELDAIIQLVLDYQSSGLIIANTTTDPAIKAEYGWESHPGGLSGDVATYREKVTQLISHTYRVTKGAFPIIGCGGVKDAETALWYLRSGASAVQIVSGFRSEGPRIAVKIAQGILAFLEENRTDSIKDFIGSNVF